MNSCQMIPVAMAFTSLILGIVITKPWELPQTNLQRLIRSILTGLFTLIIVISVFVYMVVFNGADKCLKSLYDINMPFFVFIGIPIVIIVTIGRYLGYGQLFWLYSKRKKVNHNKD